MIKVDTDGWSVQPDSDRLKEKVSLCLKIVTIELKILKSRVVLNNIVFYYMLMLRLILYFIGGLVFALAKEGDKVGKRVYISPWKYDPGLVYGLKGVFEQFVGIFLAKGQNWDIPPHPLIWQ